MIRRASGVSGCGERAAHGRQEPWRRRKTRGFTLTELMGVVLIVGIFSTLAIVSFRRDVARSTAAEAGVVIQTIRAAEESYRGENQTYLDVSKANGWYPSDSYGENPRSFAAPGHPDYPKWRRLGVQVQQPVKFRYLVNAGNPASKLPDLHISSKPPVWNMTDPWYVIQARADYDEDGIFCTALASSLNHEVFVEQEGE